LRDNTEGLIIRKIDVSEQIGKKQLLDIINCSRHIDDEIRYLQRSIDKLQQKETSMIESIIRADNFDIDNKDIVKLIKSKLFLIDRTFKYKNEVLQIYTTIKFACIDFISQMRDIVKCNPFYGIIEFKDFLENSDKFFISIITNLYKIYAMYNKKRKIGGFSIDYAGYWDTIYFTK
jgi:hypothetical protein